MTKSSTRREILKGGLAVAGLGVLGFPEWALPALAQGETLVPFTDLPGPITLTPAVDRRIIDISKIAGPFTPRDQFFTTQHYGHPDVDPATYRLKISGLVDRSLSISLDELKKMGNAELAFGFECSGNRRPFQGLSSNGRWTGVPLRKVLDRAGVKAEAREFVFFGADHGEEVDFRGTITKVDQQFGRSLPREKALSAEPMLAYALNGEPLTKHQGFPLRLLMPDGDGVANVKFLAEIHVQADPYLGRYQARWYRTLRGEMINGEIKWKETFAVTHMQLKSFIARVTKTGTGHGVFGVILNDGTPIRTVEVSIDGGPWQPATLDSSTKDKYSWKFFNYTWNGATPGEHTLVSRVVDVNGQVQPTLEELANKKTFLEDNSQYLRKVMIA